MNAIHRVGFIGLGAMGAPMAGHLYAKDMLAAVGNQSKSCNIPENRRTSVAEHDVPISGEAE